MRTALYRHFDAAGALLYVGISLNSIQRTAQHKHGAKWFERIARITIEWHETRAEALTAEAIAIAKESPVWNVAGRKSHPTKALPAKRLLTAVRHIRTGRLNGWWVRAEEAERLLGWFRVVFPHDRFELARSDEERYRDVDAYIYRDRELKPMDSHLWAKSEPDYAAGDVYDEAHA